jgi:Subtilase family
MPRFIVTANKLNRRSKVPASLPDPNNIVDVVLKNFIFEASEVPDAEMPSTVHDKWFKDAEGHFYWGGGINELRGIIAPAAIPEPAALQKQSFQWFTDLKIEQIWHQFNERGDNVTVAVLDTGYDTGNTELPDPVMTKLFVNNATNSATIQDKVGHGTFCTSIIAARNKTKNVGIAPLCKTLIGKISLVGEVKGVDTIIDGIEWAIESGAEIISISMGIPVSDAQQVNLFQNSINQVIANKNVLVFAACGDSELGEIISKEFYPASLNHCISVGTVNNDLLANITVRSEQTVLHTLGIAIDGFVLNSAIEKLSGTSMSVPIAAGVMALAVSFVKRKNNGHWNKDELLQKMISTGNPINGFPGKKIIDPLNFFKSI